MSMDKSIVGYIVSSTEAWRDNEKLGEEVRILQSAIEDQLINEYEPVLDAVLKLIDNYDDNTDLGIQIRRIYIPLKVYYENKTITL
jgi:hypothetical protein